MVELEKELNLNSELNLSLSYDNININNIKNNNDLEIVSETESLNNNFNNMCISFGISNPKKRNYLEMLENSKNIKI